MSLPSSVTVGSRTSPLSRAQTEEVLSLLRAHSPETEFVVVPITTSGDRNKDAPLLSLGRGAFVKEIELALLDREIDIAVHSAKDLAPSLPDGLTLGAIVQRGDPRDVLVDRWRQPLEGLPASARIGTSSPRRSALLKALRPNIQVVPIRGNVGTRLEKAQGKEYDGVVLAAAGMVRLGREAEVSEYLSPEVFTPDPGQGTLAVEARADASEVLGMLARIDDGASRTVLEAERAFVMALGGGCTVPVGAFARIDGGQLHMSAMAARPDGGSVFRSEGSYDARDAASAGRWAAEALLAAGGNEILHL